MKDELMCVCGMTLSILAIVFSSIALSLAHC